MDDAIPVNQIKPTHTIADLGFTCLQRIIAIIALMWTGVVWAALLGVLSDGVWQFDLLTSHWRVAMASMAMLYPAAAVGLWMLAPWGRVIAILCGLIVLMTNFLSPNLFAFDPVFVASHAGLIFILAMSWVALALFNWRKLQV